MGTTLSNFVQNEIWAKRNIEDLLERSFRKRTLSKGDFLFMEGSICKQLFFVKKGIVRSFYWNGNGRDITSNFSIEGQIVCALDSVNEHKATIYSAMALENCTVYSLGYGRLVHLMKEHDELGHLAFHLLYEMTKHLANDIVDTRCLSAKKRYDALIHKWPDIFERASIVHISSYIGIAPETLSRLKNGN